jgi:caffeoyl-CoA O-methyltransferase
MAENPATEPLDTPPLRHRSFFLDEALHHYVVSHSAAPDDVQASLIETTAALGSLAFMQVAPDQGAFLSLLVGAVRPLFAVEVGTFTGYSSLAIARALPEGGRLLCCDVSEEWTTVARRHWEAAGVADRIDLVIGPATDTLAGLPAELMVDFAFIDADKGGYLDYYEALVPRLSPHGLIAVDNVLWSGRVVDPDAEDADTVAIRAFNDHVAADPRVEAVMLSVGDGMTLIGRREEAPIHG